MPVSVVICTRDRPDDLARCLPTLLANDYPDFEVIVVDQSSADASEGVVAAVDGARLRYHRQRGSGKARALNAALARAKGAVLALTDDDCTVPRDWLLRGTAVLKKEPDAGIVFGKLNAAPVPLCDTFIPTFLPPSYRRLRGRFALMKVRLVGVGANMIVRRTVFERLGGFDECLGPGSRFRSGDDVDLAYRALRAGFTVVQDPENVVVHWGGRSYAAGSARRVLRNNSYGAGASWGKQLRCGDPLAAYALVGRASREFADLLSNLIRRRTFTGGGRLLNLIMGLAASFGQPVDRQRWLFVVTEDEKL